MSTHPDWSKLTFGLKDTAPSMYVATWTADKGWKSEGIKPYGNISMPPAAQVLNYGQGLFEGMKALQSAKDRIVLFRPLENAQRMRRGAQRMCMAELPEALFLQGVTDLVKANASHVPPLGQGSMYLRPLLIGTGPTLGLAPAPEVTFVIYSAAVGSYFKGGQLSPIDLKVEEAYHRAAPLGVGDAKCAGNYGAGLKALMAAKATGFTDVIYLDARTDTYLEELSAANIFVVKGKTIKTPPLVGTILAGVTRKSVVELAASRGYIVEETPVSISEALQADELFTTGTAVVICPVGSLTYKGEKKVFGSEGSVGGVCQELFDALTRLQTEQDADPYSWVVPLEAMGDIIDKAPTA